MIKKLSDTKKRSVVLIVSIVIIVVIIKLIQGFDNTKSSLKKLGYSKEDTNAIMEILSKEQIEKVLSLEYNEKLKDVIINKYYIPNNLLEYLNYSKNENNVDKIVSKVNTKSNQDWYTNTVETDLKNPYAILVNKFNYLNKEYKIDDLVKISDVYAYAGHQTRSEVYDNYVRMWKAAKSEDLTILVTSSFRTYEQQEKDFKNYGDSYAARPGHSEHQTGLALDISTYDTQGSEFDKTNEFNWLQENAHKYGFILRYPKDKEDITGYDYESWHYRYLGVDLAKKVHESKLTYDEYYAYYCEYKEEC